MLEKEITLDYLVKRHKKAIAEIVQTACTFESQMTLVHEDKYINAKSIMGVMALNPSDGMKLKVRVEGEDETQAMDAIMTYLTA